MNGEVSKTSTYYTIGAREGWAWEGKPSNKRRQAVMLVVNDGVYQALRQRGIDNFKAAVMSRSYSRTFAGMELRVLDEIAYQLGYSYVHSLGTYNKLNVKRPATFRVEMVLIYCGWQGR